MGDGRKATGRGSGAGKRAWGGARGGGFTLIELLVVVGIIVVLMALLLPALNAAREQGKLTLCLSNHRQIVTGLMTYASEFTVFPLVNFVDPNDPNPSNPPTYSWYSQRFLGQYLGNQTALAYYNTAKVFYCPGLGPPIPVSYSPSLYGGSFGLGVNGYVGNYGTIPEAHVFCKQTWNAGNPVYDPGLPLSSFTNPGRTLVTVDCMPNSTGANSSEWVQYYNSDPGCWGGAYHSYEATSYRHNKKTVASFADGHAESFAAVTNDSFADLVHKNEGLHKAFLNHEVTHAAQ